MSSLPRADLGQVHLTAVSYVTREKPPWTTSNVFGQAKELPFPTVEPEDFRSVEPGQAVWVHDPDPPAFALYAGHVTRKQAQSQILGIFIPILDRTVFPPLDRVHLEHPDQAAQAKCRWCSGS